jgi:hypothetical protein
VNDVSRRGFLILSGAVAAIGAAITGCDRPAAEHRPASVRSGHPQATVGTPPPARATASGRWSDPASWPNGVPGPTEVARVTKPITVDVDARVAGVVIEPSGQLIFQPKVSRRLESTGNVIVRGRLVMRPASNAVQHRLEFHGVQESRLAGGGMDVVPDDVGLWVMDAGVLDLAGSPRLNWTRVRGAVAAGDASLELAAAPSGWRPGDELVVTPTLSPATRDHAAAFDSVQVRAISGLRVVLDRPLRFHHPKVDLAAGRSLTAEVLNLTRNVTITGTAEGRAHLFIRSRRRQSLRSVSIRHMGPRQAKRSAPGGDETTLVKGRYGLHFHMCGSGSRGSLVDGVVIRDAGSHAFVAHESNGITFRNCTAFNVVEDAYWWDGPPGTVTRGSNDPGTISNQISYDGCVAALVRAGSAADGFRLSGFRLGRGQDNVCRGCVAVGVQGEVDSSGFGWGENEEGPGIWKFHNNVAHNNARHGIFWWQVTSRRHTVFDFVAYHNGGSGILNGAYGDNTYFERCLLIGNAETQFFGWAASGPSDSPSDRVPQALVDSVMDARGLSEFACILAGRSIVATGKAVGRVEGNVFRGARKACVAVTFDFHDFGPYLTHWRLHGNRYAGNQYWFDRSSHPETSIETEFGTLRPPNYPQGVLKAPWNSKVT